MPEFVLVNSTSQDRLCWVVLTAIVVLVVFTVTGEAWSMLPTVWSRIFVPKQLASSNNRKRTLPLMFPAPAATAIVAESFGKNDCAVSIVGWSEMIVLGS